MSLPARCCCHCLIESGAGAGFKTALAIAKSCWGVAWDGYVKIRVMYIMLNNVLY